MKHYSIGIGISLALLGAFVVGIGAGVAMCWGAEAEAVGRGYISRNLAPVSFIATSIGSLIARFGLFLDRRSRKASQAKDTVK